MGRFTVLIAVVLILDAPHSIGQEETASPSKQSVANEAATNGDVSGRGFAAGGGSGIAVEGAVTHIVKDAATVSSSTEFNLRNHYPLSCPKTFSKDGVYIWCDPDGIWTVFWCGRRPFDVELQISGDSLIKIISLNGVDSRIVSESENKVEIEGSNQQHSGILQFSTLSEHITFEVLIDDQSNPDQVYYGVTAESPNSQNFTLLNPQVKKLPYIRPLSESEEQIAKRKQDITNPTGKGSKGSSKGFEDLE